VTSPCLRIRFLESGVGETIVIELPDGRLAVVDAHPSTTHSRSDIADLVNGRTIAFACLTHPHQDHGLDLIKVLEHEAVQEFWYSFSPAAKFVFSATQRKKFLSPLNEFAETIALGWANFMIDIFAPVAARDIPERSLNESSREIELGGVTFHFLAPSHWSINQEEKRLEKSLVKATAEPPDPNAFSLILGIEYGGKVILLAADALKASWTAVAKLWRRFNLPAAHVLKVPHHGGKDAFDLRPTGQKPLNCWDLCEKDVVAILFAGDARHPHDEVLKKLEANTNLISLFHLNASRGPSNPLHLEIPGARAVEKAARQVQHSEIVLELDVAGRYSIQKLP